MTVQLSPEERALLLDSLRRALEDGWPMEGAPERAQDAGALAALLAQLCDLGLETLGGAEGVGLAEAVAIFHLLGRYAAPAPLLGIFVANRLLAAPGEAPAGFLAGIAARQARPAIALAAFDGDREAGVVRYADGALTGSVRFVEDFVGATHLILFTSEPAGLAVVAAADVGYVLDPGLAVPPLAAADLTGVSAHWVPTDAQVLADTAQCVRLLCAARALGAAERGVDLALDHAKVRRQFGQPIGAFQAIQHKLADCVSRVQAVDLLLASAAEAEDRGDAAWSVFTDAALAFAGPALRQVALEAHHVLGAIGYAEEHEMPGHFRRIHADLLRFGGAPRARAALAGYLLRPAA